MINALVFDFDGVLHDTFDLHLKCLNILITTGEFTAQEYRDLHDVNFHENITLQHKLKLIDFSKYHDTICDEFIAMVMPQERRQFLVDIAQIYRLFIISSGGEKQIIPYLQNNGVYDLFLSIMGMETHISKVEKFHMIFRDYGVSADEVLFITDTLGDILEGHEVGVKTIALDSGFHDRERLGQGKPYAIISSIFDIYEYLV